MLITYGMSIVGDSHISKCIPCQDYHAYKLLENGWVVAAVADGVGSAKHSEVASKMACEAVIEECDKNIRDSYPWNDVKNVLKNAYKSADEKIKEYVYKIGDSITDYDTTLSVAVYNGENLIYGHSGDGGIVALSASGDYLKVTHPQKEEGVYVVPLRAGEERWEFGEVSEKVSSVLLATDGVYDTLSPYLLRQEPCKFYVPLIRWFMDNNVIEISENNRDSIEEKRKNFLCGENCKSITDDKTVLVIFDSDQKPLLKEEAFYSEPDWKTLQDKLNKKLYPNLNVKEDAQIAESDIVEADTAASERENNQENSSEEKKEIISEASQKPETKEEEAEKLETSNLQTETVGDKKSSKKSKFFNLFKKVKK